MASTCNSLRDLLEVGVFVRKLKQFVEKKDDTVIYNRPEESASGTVNLGIDNNHMFERFEDSGSKDEPEDEDEVAGFTPKLRYHEQQKKPKVPGKMPGY